MSKQRHLLRFLIPFAIVSVALADVEVATAKKHPLSNDVRQRIRNEAEQTIRKATARIEKDATDLDAYSQRGDASFFLGKFREAVADYDRMTELNSELKSSHWRRGIALFYAGRYEDGAKQFEAYHSFDDVDRENGIWRYLCQRKAFGQKKAREGLLKYKKDDREPFPDVYRLFAGDITGEEILKRIEAAKVSDDEREKRRFYAELYIGLNDIVEDRIDSARIHFRQSTANKWGPRAGYGPNYMWHVGRLQYQLLIKSAK
ncbi:MAG: hypothetical protein AB7O26_08410 [Planctomycetaceae bacterium]